MVGVFPFTGGSVHFVCAHGSVSFLCGDGLVMHWEVESGRTSSCLTHIVVLSPSISISVFSLLSVTP